MEEIIPMGRMALGNSWSKGGEKEGPWGDLGKGKDSVVSISSCASPKCDFAPQILTCC